LTTLALTFKQNLFLRSWKLQTTTSTCILQVKARLLVF